MPKDMPIYLCHAHRVSNIVGRSCELVTVIRRTKLTALAMVDLPWRKKTIHRLSSKFRTRFREKYPYISRHRNFLKI